MIFVGKLSASPVCGSAEFCRYGSIKLRAHEDVLCESDQGKEDSEEEKPVS
jgi:hypothetical protein